MIVAIAKPIQDYLDFLKSEVVDNMNREEVNATGATRSSIEVHVEGNKGQFLASPILKKTETGNPPKNKGGGITLTETILWVEAKGIEVNVYKVTSNINNLGTITYQFGGRTDIFTDTFENSEYLEIFLEDAEKVANQQFFEKYVKPL